MRKRNLWIAAGLLLLLSDRNLPAQATQVPGPTPGRFEIYYETGQGDPDTLRVQPGDFDAFDSEKKERVYDAIGGQVRYRAELTDAERKRILDAVLQNNLPAIKADFTTLLKSDPYMVGRLRINIDGRISEIRFDRLYGRIITDDGEWTRLRNVLAVVEDILSTRDEQQTLPRHKGYK